MAGEIFISYGSDDRSAAEEVRAAVEGLGYVCWMAPHDIRGPKSYPEQIVEAIDGCSVLIVLVSEATVDSQHVSREVDLAVEKGKPLLTIRLKDMKIGGALEYLLRLPQWMDAFPGGIAAHTEELAERLEAFVGPSSLQQSVFWSSPRQAWRWLQPRA